MNRLEMAHELSKRCDERFGPGGRPANWSSVRMLRGMNFRDGSVDERLTDLLTMTDEEFDVEVEKTIKEMEEDRTR